MEFEIRQATNASERLCSHQRGTRTKNSLDHRMSLAVERCLSSCRPVLATLSMPRRGYKLCEDGNLPHVRIANSIRVRPKDMEEFVAARRVARADKKPAKQRPSGDTV